MATTLGHDVSSHQGDINFDVFKNNSQFVICKASEGVLFRDPKLTRNKSEARRVGLQLGFYHFARPDLNNSPQSEADWFLTAIGDLRDGELLALDYEANWGGDVVAWCKGFLDRIREKLSYNALIYLNQSYMNLNWKPVIDTGVGLWIAAYTGSPTNNSFNKGQWPFAAIQQYTSSLKVPGITGNTDGDVFFGDLAALRKYGYKAPVVDPCDDLRKRVASLERELANLNNVHNTLVHNHNALLAALRNLLA